MTEAETGWCVCKTRDTKDCQWVGTWRARSRVSLTALGGVSPILGELLASRTRKE